MRSRASEHRPRATLAALLAAVWLCALGPSATRAQSAGEAPTDDEVAAAVEALEADPNLSQSRKTRTLRWVRDDEPKQPEASSDFLEWLGDFFTWLGEVSRTLMWVVGGLLALGLAWLAIRLFREVGPLGANRRFVAPTHVRDMDIRPESLPDDIGGTALGLWRQGEHRAALSLLYRGLLSRLAHVHEVPIRDSSTEGDCLALASRHLPPTRRDYVARLIGDWQRAVYGGRDPATEEVEALCRGFDAALAPTSTVEDRRA